jgi:hypothetical protein
MVQVRFNTNYDVLPDQKRWRVLIDGAQIFTNSVDIRTKSWTTKDLITGEDDNQVEKHHISCKPEIITTNEDGVQLKDYDETKEEGPQADMVCVGWSESAKKWRVYIKGDERFFDEILFKTDVWTSDISSELCCRPKHIGVSETTANKTLYLSDNF